MHRIFAASHLTPTKHLARSITIRSKAVQQEASTRPTRHLRILDLPLGTTRNDILSKIDRRVVKLTFDYDSSLNPLRSCRLSMATAEDALHTRAHFKSSIFVKFDLPANPCVATVFGQNGGNDTQGRLVLLQGYPEYFSVEAIRSHFSKDYDLVDTTTPAVQFAPQDRITFLVRRGAFVLQFVDAAEAWRFVRRVNMTTLKLNNTAPNAVSRNKNLFEIFQLKARVL